ncbi:hypothetical protein L484_019436 [Morus notabilis]|uniref:Thionin-like protein 2 n=1 Tax=Morus notabilis TaxID=981085 RepID=W9S4W4_9ROSA|nr:hypothetical protein L484_019436 [Morus notabilis]
MEKVRRMGWVLTGLMVLGVLVGEANASFKSCYESCFLLCLITPNHSAFSCSYKCLKDCIIPSFKQTQTTALLHEDDGSEKVESCVDSCSDTCTKN